MFDRISWSIWISVLIAIAASCAPRALPPPPTNAAPTDLFAIKLTSAAFTDGAAIPKKFSCDGDNVSPALKWSGGFGDKPKSFALIVDDPDAPGGTFTHWVLFDLAGSVTEIPEGAQGIGKPGKNSAGKTGYTGPCPPSGTHRYFFSLYSLNVESLGLNDGATRTDVEKAMVGHIQGMTQLMGKYSR
jgi:Raf kinase inhibitor-like YbhB/YbcL family protein